MVFLSSTLYRDILLHQLIPLDSTLSVYGYYSGLTALYVGVVNGDERIDIIIGPPLVHVSPLSPNYPGQIYIVLGTNTTFTSISNVDANLSTSLAPSNVSPLVVPSILPPQSWLKSVTVVKKIRKLTLEIYDGVPFTSHAARSY